MPTESKTPIVPMAAPPEPTFNPNLVPSAAGYAALPAAAQKAIEDAWIQYTVAREEATNKALDLYINLNPFVTSFRDYAAGASAGARPYLQPVLTAMESGNPVAIANAVTTLLTNPKTPAEQKAALGNNVGPYINASTAWQEVEGINRQLTAALAAASSVRPPPAPAPAPLIPPARPIPRAPAGFAAVDFNDLAAQAASMVILEQTALTPASLIAVLNSMEEGERKFYAAVFTGAARGVRQNTDALIRLATRSGATIPGAFVTDRGVNHSALASAGHMMFLGAPEGLEYPAGSLAAAYSQSLPGNARNLNEAIPRRNDTSERSALMSVWKDRASTWDPRECGIIWNGVGRYATELTAGAVTPARRDVPVNQPATAGEIAAAREARAGYGAARR